MSLNTSAQVSSSNPSNNPSNKSSNTLTNASGQPADLFGPATLKHIELKNRVVMAPMTRCRNIGNLPGDLQATYYGQRAEAGLIVTEGTSPSPNGLGYARMPGLFNPAHRDGWSKTTSAVHARGGKIFVQLMHAGRVGHPLNLPPGARLLGPSAVALANGTMWTDTEGMQPIPTPEPMTETDIETAIAEFADSAALAIEAGFDGIELHGANGYLIEQFLNTAANHRTDSWGGSVENRARFALEVARRTADRIGAGRVAIRLSPYGVSSGMVADAETDTLYTHLAAELGKLGIAYIHLVDHSAMGAPKPPATVFAAIRNAFSGTLILCGGFDATSAQAALAEGKADLIAFGRPFIANPDLVQKLKTGAALRDPDRATFYSATAEGYTDWPTGSPA